MGLNSNSAKFSLALGPWPSQLTFLGLNWIKPVTPLRSMCLPASYSGCPSKLLFAYRVWLEEEVFKIWMRCFQKSFLVTRILVIFFFPLLMSSQSWAITLTALHYNSSFLLPRT